jgi:hypothetical protein
VRAVARHRPEVVHQHPRDPGALGGARGLAKRARQQAAATAQQQTAQAKASFNKAFDACLEGRNYAVR